MTRNICIITDFNIDSDLQWYFQKLTGLRIFEYTPLLFANRKCTEFETLDVNLLWMNIQYKEARLWFRINEKDLVDHYYIVQVYKRKSFECHLCKVYLKRTDLLNLHSIDSQEFYNKITNISNKIKKPKSWLCC